MSNINLVTQFNQDNKIGDTVKIYLNSGDNIIIGTITEIRENSILIQKEDGRLIRLFENIIGGWVNLSTGPGQSMEEQKEKEYEEEKPDDAQQNGGNKSQNANERPKESRFKYIVDELKQVFEDAKINENKIIETNTVVTSDFDPKTKNRLGLTSNGEVVRFQREGFTGDPKVLDIPGSRLFCRPIAGEQPLKSYVTIAQMTYGELLKFFEQYMNSEEYVKVICIVKALRYFSDFKDFEDQLRNIRNEVSPLSKIATNNSIVEVLEPSQEDERNIEKFILDKINSEDKFHPVQDCQLKSEYTYENKVRFPIEIYEKAREKLNILPAEYRKQDVDYPFIRDCGEVMRQIDALNRRFDIDKNTLLYHLDAISKELEPNFDDIIRPNAFIQKVQRSTFVTNYNGISVRCFYNQVLDFELIKHLSEFSEGTLPVYVSTYVKKKNGETSISNIVDVLSIREHVSNIIHFIKEENYLYARRYFKMFQKIFKQYLSQKGQKHYRLASINLKKATFENAELPLISINFSNKIQAEIDTSKKETVLASQKADENLLRNNVEEAIESIKLALESQMILPKDKGVLYQKLIQIYTTEERPLDAISTYRQWIEYGDSNSLFSQKKLSRMYTDLARLQYSTPGYSIDALESLKTALQYNPENKLSLNLQEQIKASEESSITSGQELQVSSENKVFHSLDVVSDMLDLDIQEHSYTDKRILSNNGVPTIDIANKLLEEAKSSDDVESYPVLLETAKAFHDLNFFDQQDYIYVVANYARQKGNFLYGNFRKSILSKTSSISEEERTKLCLLKDSAQSYYMESLNLWSYISSEDEDDDNDISDKDSNEQEKKVLEVLVNHMILDVAFYQISQKTGKKYDYEALFKMQFKDVFFNCMRSQDDTLRNIAAATIVKVGSYSSEVWNRLASLQNGISGLYGILRNKEQRSRFYSSINKVESSKINTDLSPKEFLQESFKKHSSDIIEFKKLTTRFKEEVLSPLGMETITAKWKDIAPFYRLLSETDKESASKVDDILTILKPYPFRGDDERSTLLYQVTEIIDDQIQFINENTTFYGRTFFYPLFNKWASEIRNIRKERVASKQPKFSAFPDPFYILDSGTEKTINLIIKNIGETTAEGFSIGIELTSLATNESYQYSEDRKTEIPINQTSIFSIALNNEIDYSKGINLHVDIAPIYQGHILQSVVSDHTVEEEPKSLLKPSDIIWSDGPITPKKIFFGRQELIDKLEKHYLSYDRHKPYILFGLTRTGKSSIVKYLGLQITGKKIFIQGQEKTVLHFSMDLDEAAKCPNAKEVWYFFIKRCLYEQICKYAKTYPLKSDDYKPSDHPRSYELDNILKKLNEDGFYPFITMDEFSYMKTLIKTEKLTAAFLHTLRKFSFGNIASFMYVGTYDINDLFNNKEYGITGQFTHCINYQLNEIEEKPAKQLINVLGDKLIFTEDAQDYICRLSGRVPYFIQIICQNCGKYAIEKKRRYIGYPELIDVIKVLTGETESYDDDSELQRLPINTFEDNQYSANDPSYVLGLVASISYLNRDCDQNNALPRGVAIDELERLWINYGIENAKYYIGEAIKLLLAKKIIKQENEDVLTSYTIIVDLYRRWCKVQYPDLNLVLSPLLNFEN